MSEWQWIGGAVMLVAWTLLWYWHGRTVGLLEGHTVATATFMKLYVTAKSGKEEA